MDWIKKSYFSITLQITTQEGALFWLARVVSETLLVKEVRGGLPRGSRLFIEKLDVQWWELGRGSLRSFLRSREDVAGPRLLLAGPTVSSVWGLSLSCHAEGTRVVAGGTGTSALGWYPGMEVEDSLKKWLDPWPTFSPWNWLWIDED